MLLPTAKDLATQRGFPKLVFAGGTGIKGEPHESSIVLRDPSVLQVCLDKTTLGTLRLLRRSIREKKNPPLS